MLRRAQPWLPALLATALAVLYLVWNPLAPDLAAQVFRTDLFEHDGFTLWNGQWFGGHYTPGYSVVFPPLAALLGSRLVACVAAVASAALFDRIARRRWGEAAWLGSVWFAAATASNLLIGRLTFVAGVAVGLGAVLAAQRDRRAAALGLAALCTLTSPVAGLFLALAGVADAIAGRRREGVELAAAALVPLALLGLAFPDTGRQTFEAGTFWPLLAFSAVALVLLPRRERALRAGVALYGIAALAAFFLDTPVGSNIERLGMTFGPPLLACALWPRRRWALLALAPLLLLWQWKPTYNDLVKTGDRSVHASYYAPLVAFLAAHRDPPGRVEIVPTRTHWEVVHVSERFPIARGWERQLDTRYGELFYAGPLNAATYRAWLDRLGVRYVALPDAPRDFAARKEGALVARGLPYLREVWRSAHWRVFAVAPAAPLSTGAVSVTRLGRQSVEPRRAATPSCGCATRRTGRSSRDRAAWTAALTAWCACASGGRARCGWRSASRRGAWSLAARAARNSQTPGRGR
jgi:hypothetical protein